MCFAGDTAAAGIVHLRHIAARPGAARGALQVMTYANAGMGIGIGPELSYTVIASPLLGMISRFGTRISAWLPGRLQRSACAHFGDALQACPHTACQLLGKQLVPVHTGRTERHQNITC